MRMKENSNAAKNALFGYRMQKLRMIRILFLDILKCLLWQYVYIDERDVHQVLSWLPGDFGCSYLMFIVFSLVSRLSSDCLQFFYLRLQSLLRGSALMHLYLLIYAGSKLRFISMGSSERGIIQVFWASSLKQFIVCSVAVALWQIHSWPETKPKNFDDFLVKFSLRPKLLANFQTLVRI